MTRVLALAGRRPSGVDRVCLAYLRAVLADDVPCFGLVRTGLGYVLLDQIGMRTCLEAIEGQRDWPAPDFVSRLRHRAGSPRRVPDTMARQMAIARARPRGLGRMLRRYWPTGRGCAKGEEAPVSPIWRVKTTDTGDRSGEGD